MSDPVASWRTSDKSRLVRKLLRELQGDEFVESAALEACGEGATWTPWCLAIRPERVGNWFAGPKEGKVASILQITREELPTCTAGMYELAVQEPVLSRVQVVPVPMYVGRAVGHTAGSSLRRRLGRYLTDGSHLSNEIREFLNLGFSLHVRWCSMGAQAINKKIVVDAERKTLGLCDWAWNDDLNNSRREAGDVFVRTANGSSERLVVFRDSLLRREKDRRQSEQPSLAHTPATVTAVEEEEKAVQPNYPPNELEHALLTAFRSLGLGQQETVVSDLKTKVPQPEQKLKTLPEVSVSVSQATALTLP
jgi:hypothetical protein